MRKELILLYATINHHGLGVEGRGGDALSVRLDAKADGMNDEGGIGGNGRAEEVNEHRRTYAAIHCRAQGFENWGERFLLVEAIYLT